MIIRESSTYRHAMEVTIDRAKAGIAACIRGLEKIIRKHEARS